MKNQLTFFKSEKTLCCVYHCNSRLFDQVLKNLKFHKLPCTNRELLLKWVNEIKLPRRISNSMVVCSKHFTDEDYELSRDGEKELKGDAVPSKHLPMVWRNKFLPRQYGRLIKLLELRGIGRLRLCFEAKLARQIRSAQKRFKEKKQGKKPIESFKLLEEKNVGKEDQVIESTKDVEDTNLPKVTETISLSRTDLTLIPDSPTQNNNILTINDEEERSLTSEIVIKEEPVSEPEDGEETVEEMLAKMNEEPSDDIHVTQVENISRMDFDYEVAYESDSFACNVCGEEDCDGHEEKYECTPCGRQFEKMRQLNAHNLCHFARRKGGGRDGNRSEAMCKLCKKVVSTSKMSLNQHMLTHSKMKSYVCMLCDRPFYNKVSLVQHINSHTIHANYRCKVCGQCFGAEIDLDLHVKKHRIMKQDFLCRECGQKFRNKQECWAHLNSHYRAKSARPGIACEVCGRILSTRATLREHMFIHSGEKPFECQLCGRKIRHRANFIIHVQGHSLGQPHLCNLCGMGFSKKVALGSHIAAEHPQDRPYLCIICGLRFRSEAKFQKHAVSHDASLEDEL